MAKVKKVKKMEDGTFFVLWSGSKKFVKVSDPTIIQYIIYSVINN